ncbi:MAG TPA: tetratricopeptide repeat protein, partial [Pyrinomonadaceae bacterium]|nr:tetratricopeptide repeat protein [Pyrinomonadaceae bacterium]
PVELDRVVMKALAKKAGERYQSAKEMLGELRGVHGAMSDEDKHRTLRFSTNSSAASRKSALMTLNYKLKSPMLSIRFVLLVLLGAALAVWGFMYWRRPTLHRPTTEAEHWYVVGTQALRDGAFDRASKSLERAVAADDKYALAHARLAEAQMELDYADRAKDELLKVGVLVPDRSIMPQVDALYLDAINAVATRDFPRAIGAYQQILKLTPDDATNKASVYVDLGRAYEKNDDVSKAIESYVEATQRDPGDAMAFLHLGTLYARKQDTTSAVGAINKAEALFQTASNVEGRTEVLYLRAILLRDAGKFSDAQALLEQALTMARDNNNDTQQIYIRLQLGRVFYSQGEIDQAQVLAQQAMDFAQQRGLDNLAARGINERGWAYLGIGAYPAAEKDFNRALGVAQRNRLPYLEASSQYGLGSVLIQQFRTDEGLAYIRQALDAFEQRNYRRDISLALTSLGRGLRRKGEYEAALDAFQKKLQLDQEANDQRRLGFAYDGMASVYLEQGRYQEALDNYEKVLTINSSLGDKVMKIYALMNRGNTLWRLGRYDEATASLDQSAALNNQPGANYNQVSAEIQTVRAQMALSQGNFPEAKTIAQKYLATYGSQYKELEFDANYVLCLTQVLSGKGPEGQRLCEEAVNTATSLGDALRLSNAMLALAQAQLETGDAQNASTNALRVRERFHQGGQQESEWRAWLIAAIASRRKGDEGAARDQLAHAKEVLSQLEQKWGTDAFSKYLNRPDIQTSHTKLGGS